ncbi:DNA-directed RNA polymerase subunit delta [Metamycoplasma hominis]|uniref:Uncharacterized protein n=2 Tax=Metamycoplasma hominis TaxID=2098 RepID=D1J7K5_METH1|nr:hypothetical protein [Metamycoplasma hominis]AIU33820.1 hypothetical protein MLBD4_00345 [Metamycoplasma hominis ATCC 27545]AKJ52344.1 hypothetical protein MHOMSp_00350 [Metamycoplasma hominis]AUW36915.1 hypothetical protein C1937_00335 [Metamycoplasma hominis]AYN65193.1 hypothetical protein KN71_000465 [Metamycoplasma hominis]MBD3898624.1 hypothetical protein [Metamycoplasma hominis]
MEYKSQVDIAKEILDRHDALDFETLFNYVKDELLERWKEELTSSISDEELLIKKRGELYKLLTIDGRFFKKVNGLWTSKRPEFKN